MRSEAYNESVFFKLVQMDGSMLGYKEGLVRLQSMC